MMSFRQRVLKPIFIMKEKVFIKSVVLTELFASVKNCGEFIKKFELN